MKFTTSINKKLTISTLLALISIATAFAQTTTLRTLAGRKGIWIICGDKLPKDFTYQVFRKKSKGEWAKLADVNFPASKDEVLANLLNVQRTTGDRVTSLSDDRLNAIWQRITTTLAVNSPPEIQDNYALRQATGTAFYDATADSAVSYQYKVQLVNKKGGAAEEHLSNMVAYPGAKFTTVMKLVSITPTIAGIHVVYEIADKGAMTHCKIFRSYYLRGGHQEIDPKPIFANQGGKSLLIFSDNTAVAKVPYSYIVLPLDAAGNPGDFSPEAKAFDVADKTIAPSVTNFKTKSLDAEKAIKLSWTLKNKKDITSLDIYKSATYNGRYVKVASVRPADTTYVDTYVRPIETYYYSVVINGSYEASPNSPRVSGILKASDKNLFPPQNLRVQKQGSVVYLTWRKMESDTRAYYVFRAAGIGSKMEPIGRAIITDKTNIVFKDSLPTHSKAMYYHYEIADENTSYAISPRSKGVTVYMEGYTSLPIPYDVRVRKVADGKLQVIWPDMQKGSNISGYMVYRRAVSTTDSSVKEPLKPVAIKSFGAAKDQYIDTAVKEGMKYYYSVRTVGSDINTLSSPSLEAGFTIEQDVPNTVSNIRVFASGKSVELKWDNPMGQNIKSIKILRALPGKPSEEIVSLGSGAASWSDKDIATGKIYYYSVVVQNNKGINSRLTSPIGIHIQ